MLVDIKMSKKPFLTKAINEVGKKEAKFNTPILYLVFNRLDSVKKTFPEIAKQKPKQLFIAADGSRNPKEKKLTDSVRKYILERIDWNCEIKTLFRAKNLGCKYAVSSAIDWFFENVEQGIIIEDDILIDPSFFKFTQEMLDKYKNNEKIMSITGHNIFGKSNSTKNSYIFSKYFFCGGWATWRNSWKKMDLEMEIYKKYNDENIKNIFPGAIERLLYKKRFSDNILGKISSWATSFFFTHLHYDSYCIVPKNNLIENIGFSKDSTHTDGNFWDIIFLKHNRLYMEFPLKFPSSQKLSKKFDKRFIYRDLSRVILKKTTTYMSYLKNWTYNLENTNKYQKVFK